MYIRCMYVGNEGCVKNKVPAFFFSCMAFFIWTEKYTIGKLDLLFLPDYVVEEW